MMDIPLAKLAANAFPLVPIRACQFIPPDSMRFCDSVIAKKGPISASQAWFAQTSAYYKVHQPGSLIDTIEIVGQIIVPPRYISFTSYGALSFTLRDTASNNSGAWMSIFVRPAAAADTTALIGSDLLTFSPGDIIRLRGYVDEFPTSNFASYTEFVPFASTFIADPNRSPMTKCVEYIGTKPIPQPDKVAAVQFMHGGYNGSGSNIQASTGEPWEDCYVYFTNLTVSSIINTTNGTFSMVDLDGNEIGMMDGSTWFTTRTSSASGSSVPYRDPASTYTLPTVGQNIDMIRGYIATNSGSDSPRGYRIYPVFPGDIVFGKIKPAINTHRRNPVALTSTDTATIMVKAYKQSGGAKLQSVTMKYRINNSVWVSVAMTGPNPADSTWKGVIPPQPSGTTVNYFFAASDSAGLVATYASAARGSAAIDTLQGFFLYTVKNTSLTIYDIQYTPFSNGMSGLIGDTAIVNGVVTADSSTLNAANTSGTTPWYIQNGSTPWNGLWVTGSDSTLYKLKAGDSVQVKGVVSENLDGLTGQTATVTRLNNATAVRFASGKTLPHAIVLQSGDVGSAGNGSVKAEPYEGMVVRFNNVTVTDTLPTFSDATEFAVNDGSGPVIVRGSDGKAKYSNNRGDIATKKILQIGDKFSYVQGIFYSSFNAYKIVIRDNNDYGNYTSVGVKEIQGVVPVKFALEQNYPNPFNPSTAIEYSIPVSGMTTLKIYNLLGQEVISLINGYQSSGKHVVQFNAERLSSGVYFYRLQSNANSVIKKMMLLK